jgi:hypothetical protein
MKIMILVFSMLAFVTADAHSQKLKGLTRTERSFVKNVVDIHKEKVVEVTKRNDNHIVIEFETTMVVLKPDGYVGEMWILTDGDWLSLGTEEDAY